MTEDLHLPDVTRTVSSFDVIKCDGCQRETHISTRIGGEAACRCGRVHVTAGILIVSKGASSHVTIDAAEFERLARANAREPSDPNEAPAPPPSPQAITGNIVSLGSTMGAAAALNGEVAPQ